MKKIGTLLIFLALVVVCLVQLPADTQAASESDLTFKLCSDGQSYYVSACNSSASGELVIPSTYNGKDVTSIGAYAFYMCLNLSNITIPNSVTTIGVGAFSNCDSLTNITIPNGVTNIEDFAFKDCDKLTNVTIGDSVTSIGAFAFSYCDNLTNITIPDSIQYISGSSFAWSPKLNYNIYDNAKYLGNQRNPYLILVDSISTDITHCTISAQTKVIAEQAFYNCEELTNITIPDSVTSIGPKAFSSCDNLISANIPSGVTSISPELFWFCKNLKNVVIDGSVTTIGSEAFYSCKDLSSISIPNSVKSIGKDAFSGCNDLTDVYITDPSAWCKIDFENEYSSPMAHGSKLHILDSAGNEITEVVLDNTVTSIPDDAFQGCSSLNSISIPDSVTSIGASAFYDCSALTSINLPSGITTILGNTFNGCTGLRSVTLPDSITLIAAKAFYSCTSLWHVLYKGTQTQWNTISINEKNTKLTNATTHYECTGNEIFDLANKKCSICLANCTHPSWSSTIIERATCKDEGVKQTTCYVCGDIWTDSIPKLTTHTYGIWVSLNEATHKRICSICQYEETATHKWNSGAVTKQPTCKEAGKTTYTCTSCGGIKTESVAKLLTHTYDNACDTGCNVCGGARTVSHQYSTNWSATKTNHWYECDICGDQKDFAAHTSGTPATESAAQTCTVCSYIIAPAIGHTHNYSASLSCTREGHWYACAGCNEQKDYAAHVYDNACDINCNTCGYIRVIAHDFAQTWASDAESHWHACTVCGEKSNAESHIPGMQATATTAQICTVCGYEMAPATGEPETQPTEPTPTEPTPTEPTPTEPTPTEPIATEPIPSESVQPTVAPSNPVDGGAQNNNGNPIWIYIVVAVALAGVAVGVILWKKRR